MHKINNGDTGRKYEIVGVKTNGNEIVIGWADSKRNARLLKEAAMEWPILKSVYIKDRRREIK